MKINGPNGPNGPAPLRSYQGGKPTSKTGGGDSVANDNSADRVEVSGGAQALANARAPEEPDMQRIQRLKDAIANGTFVIDHDRIAQRLLDEEQ